MKRVLSIILLGALGLTSVYAEHEHMMKEEFFFG